MKLLAEYADLLVRSVNAFESKVGGKYSDLEAVEAMIPTLRQDAIILKYNGSQQYAASKKIDAACVQSLNINIVEADQNKAADHLVFACPRFVNISPKVGGDIYVGQKDILQSFRRVSSSQEVSMLQTRGYLNNGKVIMYHPVNDELYVYGNKMLKSVYVQGIFENPLDVPSFNPETDVYPMSEEIFSVVMDLFKMKLNITLNQAQDNVDNDVNTESRARIKAANQ